MKIRQRPLRRARIEIIPMIDVIFFLLVFFMVSSLAMTRQKGVPVALPKTSGATLATESKAVLSVRRSGDIFVNQTPVTLQQIGVVLSEVLRNHPQETVLVNADEGSSYGRVMRAMEAARQIGVRKFSLATDSSSVSSGDPSAASSSSTSPSLAPVTLPATSRPKRTEF